MWHHVAIPGASLVHNEMWATDLASQRWRFTNKGVTASGSIIASGRWIWINERPWDWIFFEGASFGLWRTLAKKGIPYKSNLSYAATHTHIYIYIYLFKHIHTAHICYKYTDTRECMQVEKQQQRFLVLLCCLFLKGFDHGNVPWECAPRPSGLPPVIDCVICVSLCSASHTTVNVCASSGQVLHMGMQSKYEAKHAWFRIRSFTKHAYTQKSTKSTDIFLDSRSAPNLPTLETWKHTDSGLVQFCYHNHCDSSEHMQVWGTRGSCVLKKVSEESELWAQLLQPPNCIRVYS